MDEKKHHRPQRPTARSTSNTKPGTQLPEKPKKYNMETIRGTHDLEKEFSSQWESVNAAAVTESTAALLKDVYQALEASQITDQDIWEGSPEIFPILKHFSAQLQTAGNL
jgi:hypothetical protein